MSKRLGTTKLENNVKTFLPQRKSSVINQQQLMTQSCVVTDHFIKKDVFV